MAKRILIMGSFDTKAEELTFLRERVAGLGFEAVCMDTSMGRESAVKVEIGSNEVSTAAGVPISTRVQGQVLQLSISQAWCCTHSARQAFCLGIVPSARLTGKVRHVSNERSHSCSPEAENAYQCSRVHSC